MRVAPARTNAAGHSGTSFVSTDLNTDVVGRAKSPAVPDLVQLAAPRESRLALLSLGSLVRYTGAFGRCPGMRSSQSGIGAGFANLATRRMAIVLSSEAETTERRFRVTDRLNTYVGHFARRESAVVPLLPE